MYFNRFSKSKKNTFAVGFFKAIATLLIDIIVLLKLNPDLININEHFFYKNVNKYCGMEKI